MAISFLVIAVLFPLRSFASGMRIFLRRGVIFSLISRRELDGYVQLLSRKKGNNRFAPK